MSSVIFIEKNTCKLCYRNNIARGESFDKKYSPRESNAPSLAVIHTEIKQTAFCEEVEFNR
jgi:hypothetical protein